MPRKPRSVYTVDKVVTTATTHDGHDASSLLEVSTPNRPGVGTEVALLEVETEDSIGGPHFISFRSLAHLDAWLASVNDARARLGRPVTKPASLRTSRREPVACDG